MNENDFRLEIPSTSEQLAYDDLTPERQRILFDGIRPADGTAYRFSILIDLSRPQFTGKNRKYSWKAVNEVSFAIEILSQDISLARWFVSSKRSLNSPSYHRF